MSLEQRKEKTTSLATKYKDKNGVVRFAGKKAELRQSQCFSLCLTIGAAFPINWFLTPFKLRTYTEAFGQWFAHTVSNRLTAA